MSTLTYISQAGDTVDYIAWRHYGQTAGRVTEQVLEANRGLADYGPFLPAGVPVVVPVLSVSAPQQEVVLWV